MKRLLIFIFLCISISTFAQKKFFEKALKNGRSSGSFYRAQIDSDKAVKENDIYKYAAEKNYIFRNITFQDVNRFGDKFRGVKSVDFLPRNEVPKIICEDKFKSLISYTEIVAKNKGSVFFWTGTSMFKFYFGFYWSGNVLEGLVNGEGEGFYFNEVNKSAFYFKGNFINGVLQGQGIFATYEYSYEDKFDIGNLSFTTINIDNVYNDEMALLNLNGKKGFINKNMKDGIYPKYKEVLEGFKNGQAVVINDQNEEIIINKNGSFIGYTEKQKRIIEQKRIADERERIERENRERERQILAEQRERERQIVAEKKRQQEEENRRLLIENRRNQINNIEKGDIICYSEDWQHSEFFGFWKENYKMVATMIVEDVTASGKVILVVNNINSSNRNRYSQMKYGKLEIKENQKFSVTKGDMIYNNGFQFCQ